MKTGWLEVWRPVRCSPDLCRPQQNLRLMNDYMPVYYSWFSVCSPNHRFAALRGSYVRSYASVIWGIFSTFRLIVCQRPTEVQPQRQRHRRRRDMSAIRGRAAIGGQCRSQPTPPLHHVLWHNSKHWLYIQINESTLKSRHRSGLFSTLANVVLSLQQFIRNFLLLPHYRVIVYSLKEVFHSRKTIVLKNRQNCPKRTTRLLSQSLRGLRAFS